MNHPMLGDALAKARISELRAEAERARLVARAKRSHPAGSAWKGSDTVAAEEIRVVQLEQDHERVIALDESAELERLGA